MGTVKVILDEKGIERVLRRIACEILEVNKGAQNLVLVGIHTRGVYLAKRLVSMLKETEGVEVPAGTIDITLYRDDWTQIGYSPVVKNTDIPFSVNNKHVVLVDDVLFTGRTVRSAMDALMDYGRPDRIELAVLVDRGHRELPIQGDYTGKFARTDRSQRVNVLLRENDGKEQVEIEEG